MKIGIITAMPEETGALLKRLGPAKKITCGNLATYFCDWSGHKIMLCQAGMGFDNAARAAEIIIRESRPSILISCGFCGGIARDLKVGDIVVATEVVIVSGNLVEEVPVEIPAICYNFVIRQTVEGARIFGGLFASTPSILAKATLAALLPPESKCPVVEMESAAIAIIAVENNIRFAGIRAVSDPFDEELGFTLDEFCDKQMNIRIPRVLLTILRKPFIIPQLIRLAGNSRVAGASLAQAVEQFLAVV
jgi:adenosylhomocysteine nucleosidase